MHIIFALLLLISISIFIDWVSASGLLIILLVSATLRQLELHNQLLLMAIHSSFIAFPRFDTNLLAIFRRQYFIILLRKSVAGSVAQHQKVPAMVLVAKTVRRSSDNFAIVEDPAFWYM